MLRSATTFSTPVWLWRLIGPLVFWMAMTGAIALAFPIGGSGRSPFVPLGLRATPPAPFLEFCLHEPAECGLRSSDLATPEARADFWRRYFWTIAFASHPEPLDANLTSAQSVTVTPAVLVELDAINSYVNRTIRYVPDTVAYGEPDHWDLPIKDGNLRGDCEEFALEKRRLLAQAGFPTDALSLAVVQTRQGPHVVLLVMTDHGDLVLDRATDKVMSWREPNYRWISRQAPGRPLIWASVGTQR